MIRRKSTERGGNGKQMKSTRVNAIESLLIIACSMLLLIFSAGAAMAAAPNLPSGYAQYKSNGTTAIAEGGTTDETSVKIKAAVSDADYDNVQIQVEVIANASAFTDKPNCKSSFVMSGSVAIASCTGLSVGTSYKWQIRTNDGTGTSAWQQYGEINPDVIVASDRLIHNSDNLGSASYGSWGVTGGKYGEFLCETCHTFSGGTTNIKMIRQTIAAPNGTDAWPNGSTATGSISFTQADGAVSNMGDADPSGGWTGVCNVCHDNTNHTHYSYNSSDGHNAGSDCISCHLHSKAFIGSCTICHGQPPINSGTMVSIPGTTGSTTAGAHNKHANVMAYICDTCHYNNITSGSHNSGLKVTMGFSLFGGSVSGGSYDGQTTANYDSSEANTTVTNNGSMQCGNTYCHSNGTSVSSGTIPANTSANWGSGPLTCSSCHGAPPGYTNTSPKANSHSRHSHITCEKCHWSTTNTGSSISDYSKHVNRSYDIGNSTGTLTYTFNTAGGSCSGAFGCHGNATWGSTLPAQDYSNCVSCHKTTKGSRRQIVDSNGDGSGTGGDFKKTSHHHYPSSGTIANADCIVCHDTSQHPGGSVKLKNADTGTVYTYNSSNPATAENFCLSCHDTNGASGNMSPFSDGKSIGVIPYKMSKEINDNWNKTYGHKQQGLTCLGSGDPNTGCHSNGHGSDYKGLLIKNLTLPNAKNNYFNPAADEGDYEICFNCHQNYPRVTKESVLGYRLGGNFDINGDGPPPYNIPDIMTKFRDQNYNKTTGKIYDDHRNFSFMSNLHYYHLQSASWAYRGAQSSSINCISCHSVHGSNTQWGWLYDQMQYDRYAGSGGDQYGTLPVAIFNSLENYPTNCTYNCHSFFGATYNWFEPAGE